MEQRSSFPRLEARDLTGAKRWLPDAFEGTRNFVAIAFRREQQAVIDSWAPWLESASTAGVVSYEVPVLARRWAPLRSMIDGGMAAAIQDLSTRRRTLTIYGDIRRVTKPLGITDTSSVWIFLVASGGTILQVVTGGYGDAAARRLWSATRE